MISIDGKKFLHRFMPKNVPAVAVFLLLPIELISFFMRIFSMSIRLFANMVAGHSLMHLLDQLFSYILSLVVGNVLLLLIGFITFLLTYIWFAFEIFVAVLQAYVFTLLYLLYLQEIDSKDH